MSWPHHLRMDDREWKPAFAAPKYALPLFFTLRQTKQSYFSRFDSTPCPHLFWPSCRWVDDVLEGTLVCRQSPLTTPWGLGEDIASCGRSAFLLGPSALAPTLVKFLTLTHPSPHPSTPLWKISLRSFAQHSSPTSSLHRLWPQHPTQHLVLRYLGGWLQARSWLFFFGVILANNLLFPQNVRRIDMPDGMVLQGLS